MFKEFIANVIAIAGFMLFIACLIGLLPLMLFMFVGWTISWQVGLLCVIGFILDAAFVVTVFEN